MMLPPPQARSENAEDELLSAVVLKVSHFFYD